MQVRRTLIATVWASVLVCSLAVPPAPAETTDLALAWARTWNHKIGPVSPGEDALDVGMDLAADGDAVLVYGYGEGGLDPRGGLWTVPFLTSYASDGSQQGDSVLTALLGRADVLAPAGDLYYMTGHDGGNQWLSAMYPNSTYAFPQTIATDGYVGVFSRVVSATSAGGDFFALIDYSVVTRNTIGLISTWTHEIHLVKYDSALLLKWDQILAPEVTGILTSDGTALYVVGQPQVDYDAQAPLPDDPHKSLTKFSLDGTLVWQQPLGTSTTAHDFGYGAIAVAPDGFYAAGYVRDLKPDGSAYGPAQILVTRTDAAGTVLWTKSFDGGDPAHDKWYPTIDVGASAIYIAADLIDTNGDIAVLKVGFVGNQLAVTRWGGSDHEYVMDALTVGDDFYVTGYTLSGALPGTSPPSGSPPGGGDAFLIRYRGSPDSTAPTAAPTQSPAANGAGWNTGDVVVEWHWADEAGGSGLDAAHCAATSISSGEGTLPLEATCQDLAGNIGTATYTVRVDKTPPALAPAIEPFPVLLDGLATATPGATDAGSGVATAGCGAIDTSTVGAMSVICTATDVAGNIASVAVPYRVGYVFSGFLAPVEEPPVVNVGKAGRTYPIKFQLEDANGAYVDWLDAVAGVTYRQTACTGFAGETSDTLETVAESPAGLRYDAETNQYVFNWRSPGSGCYILTVALDSGETQQAFFNLSR